MLEVPMALGGTLKGVWPRILCQIADGRSPRRLSNKRGRQEGASEANPVLTTLLTTHSVRTRDRTRL